MNTKADRALRLSDRSAPALDGARQRRIRCRLSCQASSDSSSDCFVKTGSPVACQRGVPRQGLFVELRSRPEALRSPLRASRFAPEPSRAASPALVHTTQVRPRPPRIDSPLRPSAGQAGKQIQTTLLVTPHFRPSLLSALTSKVCT